MSYGLTRRSIKSFGLDRTDVYIKWRSGQVTPREIGKFQSISAMACPLKRRSISTLSFDRTDGFVRWHSGQFFA